MREWYGRARRDLPWRRTRDPYAIWVSEIMLQQTRVAAVIPYFERFLSRFPDAEVLARAPEQELLALWSGLGYYSRARNMQKAAQRIAAAGDFPREYESIRSLPGVGDYTAAAIASIAFDLPHAAVDGNVLRVLSRLENDSGDISAPRTKRRLHHLASELLDPSRPGDSNQALMELGATLCLPKRPQCLLCPLAKFCEARKAGTQNEIPVRLRRKEPIEIEATLLIVERDGRILLRRRDEGESRLAGFWELPESGDLPGARRRQRLGAFRHSITHHNYSFTVVSASASRVLRGFQWVPRAVLNELPLTTTAKKALRIGDRQLCPRPASRVPRLGTE